MGELMPVLAPDEQGYLVDGAPVFDRRFIRAMSFHQPEGLAAVVDESGAYHVDFAGRPRYEQRYRETFGFYCGLATVRDDAGYFHIDASGRPAHSRRFLWAGNFQEDLCPVLDGSGFLHVRRNGAPAYTARYSYAGDFRSGIAAVQGPGGAFHIVRDGSRLHEVTFDSAGVYHKGYAVAVDERGAFHVDKRGRPCHSHRFRAAEPFYNGIALCTTHDGRSVRLRENGYYEHLPSSAPRASLTSLRASLDAGARVGVFVRHAQRPRIVSGWGGEVLLDEKGVEQSRRLGRAFTGVPVSVVSSPVGRCQQTGRVFAEAAGAPQVPVLSTALGEPGAFFDPERPHEVGPAEFGDYAMAYLADGRARGMRDLEVACEGLLRTLEGALRPGLTLFVTHDLFVAGLLSFLGLKRPTRDDWADFLEGLCITVDPSGKKKLQRFLGLDEVRQC